MSERFQTFITRLRPHRVAILIDIADRDWQNTCLSVIEFLSQIWGGYHSIIVPTDGNTIQDIFWALLSSFDPDVILRYQKTGADLLRARPDEFSRIVASHFEQARAHGSDTNGLESRIRESIMKGVADQFSISPALEKQILIRLAPFHYENDLQTRSVRAGASADYPFTRVADVVGFVPSWSDAIFELENNLPAGREAPPTLWMAAQVGIATRDYQTELQAKGVTCVPKYMNTESDSAIMKWGIQPGLTLGSNTPFSFTRLALASVRATTARRYAIPSLIIRGDTVSDFCLYYGLSRLHGRAIWLPSWFDPTSDSSYPERMMVAARNLDDMGLHEHCQQISVISTSIATTTLQEMVARLSQHTWMSSFAVEDGNSGTFIRKIVEYPSKVYVKRNIDRITTHQIVDDSLPGFFESPVPSVLTHVNPQIHRWLAEIAFMNNETPRHPSLGGYLVTGPNLMDVRAGLDGVAFQCPGALVRGDDIELQMLRVSVSLPGPEKIFRIALANCGYDCEVSDKGRYESETIRKFGGLGQAAYALRNSHTSRLLKEFLNTKGPTDGVYDEGVFLGDKRRYLNFDCILKFQPNVAFARMLIDRYISMGVFYRGLVLKCHRCSDLGWFSIAEITQNFTCRRCSTNQQYTYPSWHYPNEPSWFYKLDEMVYQMLRHNGDVTLLTLDALARESKGSFQFAPELNIKPQSAAKWTLEIDTACIMNGKMIIGEAKSGDTLSTKGETSAQAAARYRDLAEQLGAYGVIFSTVTAGWDASTTTAIEATFTSYPHLKVFRYTEPQLLG